jgi:hypothetical protein
MQDKDDAIVSKIGPSVRLAMAAKESLSNAISEALETSTDFGYALGGADKVDEIIGWLSSEKAALEDLDMNDQYILGLDHAILLIKNHSK